jgi:hypothetical protein
LAKKTPRPAAAPRSVSAPAWWQNITGQKGPLYWLLVAAILWLILAVIYPGPMLQKQVFLSSDSSNSEAFGAVGDASLKEGHYPLWNPYLFCGMPSFGSVAYPKFVYPPTQFFNFLQQKLGFAPLTWLMGHMLFGGLGMIWLLSRWKLPLSSLILGAVIFLLFPKVVAWGVHGHGSKLGAAMYLPWIVGWALRVQDGGSWLRQLRAVALLGLLMGLQFLRGHPQITYYTLATVGWLALWNAVWPFEENLRGVAAAIRARGIGLVVVGLCLGFLVGAVLLVPQHDYAAISIRGQDTAGGGGVGLDYATGWSLAPDELGTVVLPAQAGFGKATYMGLMPFNDYPNYLGFLLLLLAAVAWQRQTRALMVPLLIFSALVVLASFGQGFYTFLYNYLPFFNKFRIPSMILILLAFSVALLAPRGVANWQAGQTGFGKPLTLPILLGALGVLCLIAGAAGVSKSSFLSQLADLAAKGGKQSVPVLLEQAWLLHKASLVRIGLVCLVAAGALWYSLKSEAFRTRGLVWVLVGLVMLDLAAVNSMIIHPERSLQSIASDGRGGARLVTAQKLVQNYVPRKAVGPGPAAAVIAEAAGHDRLWPIGKMGGQNLWMADGIRSLGGYHAAKLAQYEQIRKRLYSERPAWRLAAWLSATTVVFEQAFQPAQLEALKVLGMDLDPTPLKLGSPVVYRNRSALPRARLVTKWQSVSSLPEKDALGPFLDGIASGEVDIRETVYLTETPDPAPKTSPGNLPVPQFLVDGLDEVELQVNSPVPALLLLADMMAPGWKVEVDGVSRPLLTADLVLRAVAVDAGQHTVRFHYDDPAVRKGLTLTVIGVILILALLAIPMVLARLRPGFGTETNGLGPEQVES